jgi:archaemetzincin
LYFFAFVLSVAFSVFGMGAGAILWAESAMEDSDFQRIGEPKPGEWLFHFHEPGQSFEDYVRSNPARTPGREQVLVFQPVGPFSNTETDVINKALIFAGIWFDLPTRVEQAVPLPEEGWHRARHFPGYDRPVKQYHTGYFLHELLPPKLPEDAVCYLAITMADIYPDEQWNFVFGQASLSNRVGVYSMARYFPASQTIALRRSCKVLAH